MQTRGTESWDNSKAYVGTFKFFQILPRVYTFSTSIRHNRVYIVSNKTNTQPIRVRYIIKICHVTVSSMVER